MASPKKSLFRFICELFIRLVAWYYCVEYINFVKDLVRYGYTKDGDKQGPFWPIQSQPNGYFPNVSFWFHFVASLAAINHIIFEFFTVVMSTSLKNVLQGLPQLCMRYVCNNRTIIEIVAAGCDFLDRGRKDLNDDPFYMSPLLASMFLLSCFCGIYRLMCGPFAETNADKTLIRTCEFVGIVESICCYFLYDECNRRHYVSDSFGFGEEDERTTSFGCLGSIGLANIYRNPFGSYSTTACESKVQIERKCQDDSDIPEILANELQMAMKEPLDLYIGTYDDKPCFFLKNTNRSDTPVAILPFRRDYSYMMNLSRERFFNTQRMSTANYEPPPPYHYRPPVHTELKDACVQVS